MAALMKYVQLQHEDFTELMKSADGENDYNVSPAVINKERSSSSSAVSESPKSKDSSASKLSPTTSNIKLLSRLEAYRNAYLALTPPDNFDTPLYKSVQIVSGTTNPDGMSGTATFHVKFSAQYCNKFGTVHGGAIATLLDGLAQCSTAVVDGDANEVTMAPKRGKVRGGATRSLQVGYLRSIKVDEAVTITCEVLKSNGSSTTIRETASREADGEVLAICAMEKERHEKSKL